MNRTEASTKDDSADTSVTADLRNGIDISAHLNLDGRAHREGVVANVDRNGVGPHWNLGRKGTAGIDSRRTDDVLTLRELNAALHWLRLAIGIAGLLDGAGGAGERVAADSAVRAALRAGGAAAHDQRHGGHNDHTMHVDLNATMAATVPASRETRASSSTIHRCDPQHVHLSIIGVIHGPALRAPSIMTPESGVANLTEAREVPAKW